MRTIGAPIAALLLVFVALPPVLLRGEALSLFELLLLAAAALGAGVLLRWRGTGRQHALGSILVVLGGVSLAVLIGLILLSPRGW
jgi:uncharacterized membrane protein